jgi:hypothetical protein
VGARHLERIAVGLSFDERDSRSGPPEQSRRGAPGDARADDHDVEPIVPSH